MSLSTDLSIRGQYAPITSSSIYTSPGSGSFSQVLSAACQTGGADYETVFQLASDAYQVPADLLKAVAKAESGFNANAVSSCGAQGIMQLMPATARSLGVTNSFDPVQNIMGGAKYLRQMLDCFGGDVSKAVAAYNAGPEAVKKYGGVPPYQETQNYVTQVLAYAGGGVSVQALSTGLNEFSSNASLAQDELAEMIYQMCHSAGVYSKESMYLLVQRILLQKEEDEEKSPDGYIDL